MGSTPKTCEHLHGFEIPPGRGHHMGLSVSPTLRGGLVHLHRQVAAGLSQYRPDSGSAGMSLVCSLPAQLSCHPQLGFGRTEGGVVFFFSSSFLNNKQQ